jgi:TRAP-type C4-dicarboxylate transport system substrate-binding protein
MSPWELVPSAKIDEVTKYHTEMPSNKLALAAATLSILMSKSKYESLPADLRAVIDAQSGQALVDAAGTAWDRAIDAARKKAADAGHMVKEVSEQTYDEMLKATRAVEEEWIKGYKVDGMSGAKIISELRAISQQHFKH